MKPVKATLLTLSAFLLINFPVFATEADDFANIMQTGSNGTVTIDQTMSPGNPNLAQISQRAGSSNEVVHITQSGNGNHSATVFMTGDNDVGNVSQIGFMDTALIMLSGSSLNTSTIFQDATSESNMANIHESGLSNKSSIIQSGQGAQASIAQSGSINDAAITQEIGSGNNDATILQTGSSNIGSIDQSGISNIAEISQNGLSNSAEIVQSGNSNYANVSQAGTFKLAQLTQTGNSNSAIITQH